MVKLGPGWRISPNELHAITADLNERIDAAALAPEQWDDVLKGVQAILPGVRAGLEAWDAEIDRPLAVVTLGWGERTTQDYVDYFASRSPWAPVWPHLVEMQPYLSDQFVPFRELEKSEFYTDWLRPVGGAEHGTAIKLHGSKKSRAQVHLHYGAEHMEQKHDILSAILKKVAPRMHGALLANRVLALRMAVPSKGTIMDSLRDPAFLLDEKCRLLAANGPGNLLLQEEMVLQVGAQDALRLRAKDQHQRLAVAVKTLCRAGVSYSAPDLLLTDSARSWTLSLLPVAGNALGLAASPMLTMLVPRSLVLLVARPSATEVIRPQSNIVARIPSNLTPAEQRLLEALCEGGTLPQISTRLGIAYETARTQLKNIYGKTGVRSQRDLLSLIIRGY